MNIQETQTQILKKIRGSNTQISLSQKLGFKSNKIHKWEASNRQIKWSEFVHLCEVQKIPLEKTILFSLKVITSTFNYKSTKDIVQQFIVLYGLKNYRVVAKKMNMHPSVVQRWVAGKVEPDLISILRLFSTANDFIDLFIEKLFEEFNKEQALIEIENLSFAQLKFISNHPWALAIVSALETKRFKNFKASQIDELAEFLGLNSDILKVTINLMCEHKILGISSNKTYKLIRRDFNFNNLPLEDILRPAHFWNDRIQTKIKSKLVNQPLRSNGMCYLTDFRVQAVSKSEIDQINQAITEFVGKVSSFIDRDSKNKDSISVLILQHFDSSILPQESKQINEWRSSIYKK